MLLFNFFTLAIFSCFFADSIVQNEIIFFHDTFKNLNGWEKFQFSSGKKQTNYSIFTENDQNYLQIISDSSASGLISKYKFNPIEYPLLKWKWKINNIIPNANGKTKKGDDYPLRIFVMFEKDSSEISFWEKLQNSALKFLSGYVPPYKSLCYVWANSNSDTLHYFSPYTDDVMIICKQSGAEKCSQWIEEQVNIVDDYKKYFEEEVPSIACIAIMGDSDNSNSYTQSFINFINISKK
jgi:hypothetical protein